MRMVDSVASGRVGAVVLSPAIETQAVCTPSGCTTDGPVQRDTNRLIDRLSSGETARSIGSEMAGAPGGTVIEVAPPKVNGLLLAGSIDPGALPGRAMVAAPITTGW